MSNKVAARIYTALMEWEINWTCSTVQRQKYYYKTIEKYMQLQNIFDFLLFLATLLQPKKKISLLTTYVCCTLAVIY